MLPYLSHRTLDARTTRSKLVYCFLARVLRGWESQCMQVGQDSCRPSCPKSCAVPDAADQCSECTGRLASLFHLFGNHLLVGQQPGLSVTSRMHRTKQMGNSPRNHVPAEENCDPGRWESQEEKGKGMKSVQASTPLT